MYSCKSPENFLNGSHGVSGAFIFETKTRVISATLVSLLTKIYYCIVASHSCV